MAKEQCISGQYPREDCVHKTRKGTIATEYPEIHVEENDVIKMNIIFRRQE